MTKSKLLSVASTYLLIGCFLFWMLRNTPGSIGAQMHPIQLVGGLLIFFLVLTLFILLAVNAYLKFVDRFVTAIDPEKDEYRKIIYARVDASILSWMVFAPVVAPLFM